MVVLLPGSAKQALRTWNYLVGKALFHQPGFNYPQSEISISWAGCLCLKENKAAIGYNRLNSTLHSKIDLHRIG